MLSRLLGFFFHCLFHSPLLCVIFSGYVFSFSADAVVNPALAVAHRAGAASLPTSDGGLCTSSYAAGQARAACPIS